jgi:hypothetical protein
MIISKWVLKIGWEGALFEQVQLAQDVVQQGVLRSTVLSLLVA